MDGQQFDRLAGLVTAAQTRRGAFRLFMAAMAGTALPVLAALDADGQDKPRKKKRRKKKHHHHGHHHHGHHHGDDGGGGGTPGDQCPVAGVCNADPPVCGTGVDGQPCGCDRATEGNTVCLAFVESCEIFAPCASTQDCRDSVGFHFFCQVEKTNDAGVPCGCGGRCLPECDNRN